MPRTSWGWEITPDELAAWTLYHDRDLLVIDKPAFVVCHPSKHGPWSSLIGAAREWLGLSRLHMPSRLDRETSGVVVFAKNTALASRLQQAIQHGSIHKVYHAILEGQLREPVCVDQPIGQATASPIHNRRAVRLDGQPATTVFTPLASSDRFTLARVEPRTGRLHQIRVHAAWLGHPLAGDKIYGPDETLFLDFIQSGWTARHEAMLPLPRQALHASEWSYQAADLSLVFQSPLPRDWQALLGNMTACS